MSTSFQNFSTHVIGFGKRSRRPQRSRAKNRALFAIVAVYLAAGAIAFVAMPALSR